MNTRKKTLATALISTAAIAGPAAAEPWVEYYDNFDRPAESALDGQTPDVSLSGASWTAGDNWEHDGDGNVMNMLSDETDDSSSAVLPMPGGGVNPDWTYTITAGLKRDAIEDGNWLGLGFAQGDAVDVHMHTSDSDRSPVGMYWTLLRANGEFLMREGPGGDGGQGSFDLPSGDNQEIVDVRVVLDGPQGGYVFSYRDAGGDWVPFHAAETDPAMLEDISYVGITSASPDNAGTMGFTHFEFTAIPEPGSLALLGAGGLMLLARRRRA